MADEVKPTPVPQGILTGKDIADRVHAITQDTWNSALASPDVLSRRIFMEAYVSLDSIRAKLRAELEERDRIQASIKKAPPIRIMGKLQERRR